MKALKEKHPLLYKISQLMDNQFEIYGVKFGWDFILGLIPFYGNVATTAVSLFTVVYAAFHGVSIIVLFRMLLNISVDMLITAIPVLGNIGDIFWQANIKNYRILDNYIVNAPRTIKRSLFANLAILGTYFGIIFLIFYGLYRLILFIIHLF